MIQVLGFNLTESGLFCVLPWLTMAFSANLGGWIADTLVSKGWSVTTVRKVYNYIYHSFQEKKYINDLMFDFIYSFYRKLR